MKINLKLLRILTLRFVIVILLIVLISLGVANFSNAGLDVTKSAPGFLDQNFSVYVNTIPNNYISSYSNF